MNFGLASTEAARLTSIEAHFDVAPIPADLTDHYLECARVIYEFCKREEVEFYYEALFLAGGLVEKVPDARTLAETCMYYASRFNDSAHFDFPGTKRTLLVREMVGRYRRVTPLDVFRSLPNRAAATHANEILTEVYSQRADYYHLPVSVVAPAYYELARRLLRGLPHEHLPAYSDWRGDGGEGLAQAMEVREREPILPRRKGKYQVLSVLGEGTYGVVLHGRRGTEDFAVKQQKNVNDVVDELSVLSTYLHKNVIKFEGVDATLSKIDIFLELGTPLLKLIGETTYGDWSAAYLEAKASPRQLPVEERRGYERDLIAGLHFLHQVGVLHRDVKADNVIVVDGVAKLADFGMSLECLLGDRDNRYRSPGMYTVMNRPPEMLRFPRKSDYSFSADIWALGTVLVEIETSCALVVLTDDNEDYKKQALECYFEALGPPPVSLYGHLPVRGNRTGEPLAVIPEAPIRDFFLSLLHYNEHLRPTAEEVEKKFISHLL